MMAGTAGGQFAHPGGMPGHGMPHGAHPMGPGHPQGPGGAAVTMGQQMHMANPQAVQGAMMGMPQGAGPVPNAHALSHLNPGGNPQQLLQQQQQQQQMGNSKWTVSPLTIPLLCSASPLHSGTE
jgi:hypothetical protein